ncbi:hypothetical protein FOXG_22660 [Fusarium oxysporum f. sp. lycopersici 4287]|uniref:Uncharacterized protein n=1 Tax=Fusarium oxysporum f. sp. lycopersici (strain 4287 / CBS 123668 / FGSC 9935 / NRRL 34936) TaxID=426428 RepID=A0A0J9WAK0_FUSO4|nr:hypothetical protein FOXG_21008 [Fusarium oxysporum f. sp. lycopersici 4287]XP_018252154.1 hypothetical protein FOXG_21048 [Fusarium oxysporum f. sp. lycopersici 4287]XP_018253449.1 hypothetical protein FOXG_21309 [Fusarium oxysporum f. sp. lycopersici 4287]XP_018257913.1 hypothetical protein FOXG_22660 [Fusarium oxysporum f. sp. lycopersici 4287]KNB13993.1 hypothetical protein FOXG_21008 [Fusarium oxysporum f. sp. lycopersici 4287]KNB14109.1 hypothetical protein FOXG_21048 [Fusarium oxyspo
MKAEIGQAFLRSSHGNGWGAGRASKEGDKKSMAWDRKICSRSLQWPVPPSNKGAE